MFRRLFPNVYEGWLVVAASAMYTVVLAAAVQYGFGTIFDPIRDEFGWGVAATALAFSLRTEVNGIAAPFLGVVVDRVGPRITITFGVVVLAAALVAISLMQNIWQFYGAMVLVSVGTSASGPQTSLVAVATWFRARRGRAMAFMMVGGGLSGFLVVPMASLVESVGWRGTLQLIALLVLLLGLFPILNVRLRPRNHPQPLDGVRADGDGAHADRADWGVPVGAALRSRTFLLVTLGLAGIAFGTTSLVVLQIPFLEEQGLSKTLAAATISLYTVSSTFGRLGIGVLSDYYPKRVVFAVCMGLVALSLAMLPLVHNVWQAVPVLLVAAIGFGGSVPVRPSMIADYFGTANFGTLNGIATFVRTLGAFGGPLIVGATVDLTGGYTAGWLLAAAVVAVTILPMLLAEEPHALLATYRDGRIEGGGAAIPEREVARRS